MYGGRKTGTIHCKVRTLCTVGETQAQFTVRYEHYARCEKHRHNSLLGRNIMYGGRHSGIIHCKIRTLRTVEETQA
jgi:hypothetical protein